MRGLLTIALIVMIAGCQDDAESTIRGPCHDITDLDTKAWCITDAAKAAHDAGLCESITDTGFRAGCIALVRKDPLICAGVDDDHWRDSCLYGVAVETSNRSICKLIGGDKYAAWCERDASRLTPDFSLCENMFNANESMWCYAVIGRERDICDKIEDPYWRRSCYTAFNRSMQTTSSTPSIFHSTSSSTMPSLSSSSTLLLSSSSSTSMTYPRTLSTLSARIPDCASYKHPVQRDLCYAQLTMTSQDTDSCSSIINAYLRDSCRLTLAIDTSNKAICSELEDPTMRMMCAVELAVVTEDPNLCYNANNPSLADICLLEVAKAKEESRLCERISAKRTRLLCQRLIDAT